MTGYAGPVIEIVQGGERAKENIVYFAIIFQILGQPIDIDLLSKVYAIKQLFMYFKGYQNTV